SQDVVRQAAARRVPRALPRRGPDAGLNHTVEAGAEIVGRRPAEAETEVPIVEFEPVARTDVGPELVEQHFVELIGVDGDAVAEANQADDTAARFDPLEQLVVSDPLTHDVEVGAHALE